jgi:hypothetical protein
MGEPRWGVVGPARHGRVEAKLGPPRALQWANCAEPPRWPRRRELAGSGRDAGTGKIEGGRACVREVERKREMWAQKRCRGRENRFVRFGEEEQGSWQRLGAPCMRTRKWAGVRAELAGGAGRAGLAA